MLIPESHAGPFHTLHSALMTWDLNEQRDGFAGAQRLLLLRRAGEKAVNIAQRRMRGAKPRSQRYPSIIHRQTASDVGNGRGDQLEGKTHSAITLDFFPDKPRHA